MNSLILFLFFLLIPTICCAYKERQILSNGFANEQHRLSQKVFNKIQNDYHKQSLQNFYALHQNEKTFLLLQAEQNLKRLKWHWPTATEYMEYFRTGVRIDYEDIWNSYEKTLVSLTVGHLLKKETNSSDTHFLYEVVNGLWIMLEATTWIEPPHLQLERSYEQLKYDFLPDPVNKAIDLRSGEIARLVSLIQFLLREDFDKVSPDINRRIDYTLNERVYYPYLNLPQKWKEGRDVTNWNVWINSNVFRTAFVNIQDATKFKTIADEIFHSVDWLINTYGDDGGLIEGPAYWRQNGGRLIDLISLICRLYPDAEGYFRKQSLIQNIGDYVLKMHIEQDWFVDFADAKPQIFYPPSLLQHYGKLYENEEMENFAQFMFELQNTSIIHSVANHDLAEFFNFLEFKSLFESRQAKNLSYLDTYYMESIQVLTTRSNQSNSLFLGAKFGENGNDHNHNDVGSFILYQNGLPMLIDIGVGGYNKSTFGKDRYNFLYFPSQYHNCPTINGYQQFHGEGVSISEDVSLNYTAGIIVFKGNLAKTYPKEAQINYWNRTMTFDPLGNVFELKDEFKLERFLAQQQLNFITHSRMKFEENPNGLLLIGDDNQKMQMEFDKNIFEVQRDQRDIWYHDKQLIQAWGQYIQRIRLVTQQNFQNISGVFLIRFVPK